ncbi:MAG: hypothetical protein FWG65_00275, partial [Turicibacter sp.]|nr:hypothetical protein [Turicibacter sp.]
RYTNISKSLLEYYDVRKSIGDVSKLLLKHTDEPNFAVPENQKEKLRKHHSVRSGFIMGDVQIDFDNIEDFTKSNRAKLKYLGHVYGEKPIPELESIISESFRSLSLEWGEIESILQFINNAQGQSGINKVVRERIAVHAAELLSGVLEEYGRQSEELETANDKIDQLGRDLYAVEDTINAANKEIDQLGRDLYAAKDTINAANEERERLEGELDTANAEKEVLKGKLNTAYEKIDQLDRESKVAQGTINEYETMLQAANDKKEELQSKVTDTEEKFSAAEKEVEELNKELKKANKNKPLRTSLSRLNQNLKEETKLYQINDERRITTFIKKEAYKWVFDNIKKYEPQTKDTEDLCKQIKQSEGFTEDTTYTTYYEALANNFENNPFADKIKIDRRKPIITDDIQMYFVEYNGVKLPIGFMFDFFESDYEGKDNQDRREDVIKGFLADAKKTTLLNWDIAESDFKDKIKQATEEKFANITNFNGKDWLKFGLWTVVKTACVLALVFVSFEIFGIIEEIEEEVSMWLQPWFYFSLVIFSVLGLYGIYLLYLLGEVRLFKIGLLSVQLAFSEHHNLSKDCKNTGIQKMETHLQNVIDSANHKTRNLEITDSDTDAEEMFAELAIFNDQLDNNEKRYEKLNNVIGAYKTGFVWRWLFFAFTIITVVLYIYLT